MNIFGEKHQYEDGWCVDVHLEETVECVQAICDAANAETGCDLQFHEQCGDGRFTVRASNGCAIMVGTAAEIYRWSHEFQGGYITARVDAGLPMKREVVQ